jgi:hypothetical protein
MNTKDFDQPLLFEDWYLIAYYCNIVLTLDEIQLIHLCILLLRIRELVSVCVCECV